MAEGEQDDQSDKEFEPTPRRLDEARRKGEIPRSPDLTAAAALGGLVLSVSLVGPWAAGRLGAALAGLMANAGTAVPPRTGALLLAVALPVLPLLLLPAAVVLAVLAVQGALIVTPDKLVPRFERLGILRNARQKFGPDGLMEFLKAAVKLAAVSLVLALFLSARLRELMATSALDGRQGLMALLRLLSGFLLLAAVIWGVIGLFDLLWQRYRHRQRLRMSREDMKKEMKESEGDPHMRQSRRQRAREIAMNRMLLDVPGADVVVVNPTHYAVALKWERGSGRAPVCVAKGVDEVAARIRAVAAESGVPVRADPPTARALHAAVRIGEEVPPELYRAVAAAIRFAESMRQRARARG